ncbi:peptidoglycan editing factor PgeF [Chloroflexota bacterium]
MPFQRFNKYKYYKFSNFGNEIKHGIFSRKGGVSSHPYASLNIGSTVGDEIEKVKINQSLLLNVLDLEKSDVFDCWQVHGTQVIRVDHPREEGAPYRKGDALLTNNPNVALLMRFADCTPIFLYDPVKLVVGIVHSGWLGTVKKIVEFTVEDMIRFYGCIPGDIRAGIGPSIGPDHYEIGKNVFKKVKETFGGYAKSLVDSTNGKYFFNLWGANKLLLENCGIKNIEVSEICTACHLADWYSHRAEHGKTGRFGGVISLKG